MLFIHSLLVRSRFSNWGPQGSAKVSVEKFREKNSEEKRFVLNKYILINN